MQQKLGSKKGKLTSSGVPKISILPKYIRQHDGAVTSKIDAQVNDIIRSISKLDEKDKLAHFAVDIVGLIDF